MCGKSSLACVFTSFGAQTRSSLCVDMPAFIKDDDRCSRRNLSPMAEDSFALRQDLYKLPKGFSGHTHTQTHTHAHKHKDTRIHRKGECTRRPCN